MAVVLSVLFLSQLIVVKTSRFWVAVHFADQLATAVLAYKDPAAYVFSQGVRRGSCYGYTLLKYMDKDVPNFHSAPDPFWGVEGRWPWRWWPGCMFTAYIRCCPFS